MAEVKYLDLTGLQRYDQKIKEVVNTGLDAKISKTQPMLSIYRDDSSETYNYDGGFPETLIEDNTQVIIQKDEESGHDVFLTNNGSIVASYTAINNITFTRNGNEVSITGLYLNGSSISESKIIDSSSPCNIEQGEYIGGTTLIINKLAGDVELNTQESLNYLNENKVDKTEVESSLALKADKSEVESSISGINAALDTKIGKDDEMITVSSEPTTNTTTYSEGEEIYTNLVNGTNWTIECTLNHDDDSINFVLLDQEEVFSKELGNFKQKLILTNVNGTLTINKDEQISTITIDPSKSYKLYALDKSLQSHVDITITQGGDTTLNTQESLNYLNENKADKSDIDALDFGVKELLLGEQDLGDKVIFHDRDSFRDGQGVTGGIPLESGSVYFDTISEFDTADDTYEKKLIGRVAGFDNKANTWDIPTDISQLTNDAGYAVAGDLKIAEVTEGLGENVAKAYKFEGGAESAVIEIPKDQTLKSVELGKYATEGDATSFVVDPTGEILRFTYIIADGSESVVDVNISNLITEAELDPVYAAIDEKVAAADIVKVTNEEIDAMFA